MLYLYSVISIVSTSLYNYLLELLSANHIAGAKLGSWLMNKCVVFVRGSRPGTGEKWETFPLRLG